MIEVDATCAIETCKKPIRWAPGAPRLCAECFQRLRTSNSIPRRSLKVPRRDAKKGGKP